ncbi:glycosyltransferase family 4 protein [Streptomyces sp. S1A(2023)]
MSYYAWEKDVRQFGKLRRNFPTAAASLYKMFQSKVFPEHYLTWIPGVLSSAVKAHFKEKFDLVIATGNPFASFAAAQTLGRLLRIPYAVDYRDSWTFNQFTEELKFPEDSKAFEWESKVLRDASEIVFVNDGMRQWHIDRYPDAADRMTVVPNGWEPENCSVRLNTSRRMRNARCASDTWAQSPLTCPSKSYLTAGASPAAIRCFRTPSSTFTAISDSSPPTWLP